MDFSLGDRVKVKDAAVDGYKQPWRNRFKKGLLGTVLGTDETFNRVRVRFDVPKRARIPAEWSLSIHPWDLEKC